MSELIIIFFIGIISAIINTLAGGGSLLVLPLLIFYGLESTVANATNRVSIVLQSLTGTLAFKKKKAIDMSKGFVYTIPAIVGSIIGSLLAINTSEQIFRGAIAVVMLGIVVIVIFKPEKFLKENQPTNDKKEKANKLSFLEVIISFVIGLYAGFIQAGVGYLMLFGLVMVSGYNIIQANGLKLFLTFVLNTIALGVFFFNGLIDWKIGLTLSFGSVIGSLIGTKITFLGGTKFVRYAFIVLLIFFILALIGIIEIEYSSAQKS